MKSRGAHELRYKHGPNDEFYTPVALAKQCIAMCPLDFGSTVLDSAMGGGNFFDNFPRCTLNYNTRKFEKWTMPVDWIITNPPYSLLGKWWLQHTYTIAQKGFGYLIGQSNLTTKRLADANAAGFGLTKLHMFKVMTWYGLSYFVVFEKGKPNIITYDRKIWYEDTEE
jgi:hypothetical protein